MIECDNTTQSQHRQLLREDLRAGLGPAKMVRDTLPVAAFFTRRMIEARPLYCIL